MTDIIEITPQTIRRARETRGLSQQQLGNLLGVSPSTVARWESGAECPKQEAPIARAPTGTAAAVLAALIAKDAGVLPSGLVGANAGTTLLRSLGGPIGVIVGGIAAAAGTYSLLKEVFEDGAAGKSKSSEP